MSGKAYVPDKMEVMAWVMDSEDPRVREYRVKVYLSLCEEDGWKKTALMLVNDGVDVNQMIQYAIFGASWQDIKDMVDQVISKKG